MAYDGEIIIDVDVLTKQAEKHLDKLRKVSEDSGDDVSENMKISAKETADEWEHTLLRFKKVMADMDKMAEKMSDMEINIEAKTGKMLSESDVRGLEESRLSAEKTKKELNEINNESKELVKAMDLSSFKARELLASISGVASAMKVTSDVAENISSNGIADILPKNYQSEIEELRKVSASASDDISERMKYNARKIATEWEDAGNRYSKVMEDMQAIAGEMKNIEINIDTEMKKPLADRDLEGLKMMRIDLGAAKKEHSKLNDESSKLLKTMDLNSVKASELLNNIKKTDAPMKKTTTSSKQLGTSLKSNFKSITKYALALFSFRSIYQTLRTLSNEWMNSDDMAAQQMKANMEGIRAILVNAIAPVVQFIGNLIMNIVGYISSFLKVFFGINLAAKQAGKNINKGIGGGLSGAKDDAKEIQNILAGFDKAEVVRIDKESAGAGGGGGVGGGEVAITPEIDFSKFDELMAKLKKKIQPFIDTINSIDFNPLMKSLDKLGNSFKNTFTIIGNSIANMMNNTLGPFIKMMAEDIAPRVFLAMVPVVDSLNEALSWMLTEVVEPLFHFFMMEVVPVAFELLIGVLNILSPIIDALLKATKEMWEEVWLPFGTWISGVLLNILEGLAEALSEIGIEIGENDGGLVEFFKTLMTVGTYFLVFKGIITAVTTVLGLLSTAWGIITTVVGVAKAAFTIVGGVITTLMGTVGGMIAIITALGAIVIGVVSDFDFFKNSISNIIGNVKGILGGFIGFIKGVFTGNWSQAWQGVVQIFSNIVGGIANIFKLPINAMISGINVFIRGLNKIKIPSWVPGVGGYGINIGELPHLAKGGVLTQPTLNVAGEYAGAKRNPEIVTPEDKMREAMADVLAQHGGVSSNEDITIVTQLVVDSRTLAETEEKVKRKDYMQNNGRLRTAWS